MKFEFRSAEGRVCCSTDNPANLCPDCRSKQRPANRYAPPDAYAADITAMQTGARAPEPSKAKGKFSPPDPYTAGINAMRQADVH
jgi:hypothetical protein